jgi:hypothetical protein
MVKRDKRPERRLKSCQCHLAGGQGIHLDREDEAGTNILNGRPYDD